MNKIAVITANSYWNIHNYRRKIIERFIELNYQVYLVAPDDKYKSELELLKNTSCFDLKYLNSRGTNIFQEVLLLKEYLFLLRKLKPDIVLSYTIKPNIYTAISSRLLGVKCISSITGMGYSFTFNTKKTKLYKWLYKFAFEKVDALFFHNDHDRCFFVENGLVSADKTHLSGGSGVNVSKFSFLEMEQPKMLKILFVGRLLKSKGIDELLYAIKLLLNDNYNIEFHFVGEHSSEKIDNIDLNLFNELVKNKNITYHGFSNDVHQMIQDCNALILPSYREGMPKSVLEAMSIGRPILASRIPGCVELIKDGVNGFLFEPRNKESLKKAIIRFRSLDFNQMLEMGKLNSLKIQAGYTEKHVVNKYFEVIEKI